MDPIDLPPDVIDLMGEDEKTDNVQVQIGGRLYSVAQPLSITESFFERFKFGAEELANIEGTLAHVMEELEESAKTPRDAITGKLIPHITCQYAKFELILLYQHQTITALNGKVVDIPPCKNKEKCASQFVRGFDGTPLSGRMTESEFELLIYKGILPCVSRECLLCVRQNYTQAQLGRHMMMQKSKPVDTPESPVEVQPFRNSCDVRDCLAYKADALLMVQDPPSSQHSSQYILAHPMVSFESNRLFWSSVGGVRYVDQRDLLAFPPDYAGFSMPPVPSGATMATEAQARCVAVNVSAARQMNDGEDRPVRKRSKVREEEAEDTSGAAEAAPASVKEEGAFAPATPGTFRGDSIRTDAFAFSGHFFVPGRGSIPEEHMPCVQLSRLCAPLHNKIILELCFSLDFKKCAVESRELAAMNPGRDLQYTSWFEKNSPLERLAEENLYVRLLVVRLLIADLLTQVKFPTLQFWLYLYIDQHMPFLTSAKHKRVIRSADVIAPETIVPLSERTLDLKFLSLDVLLAPKNDAIQTDELTRIALKFMPNTGHYDKKLTWASLSPSVRERMRPILLCVVLGNFRHARVRPPIRQRLLAINSTSEDILRRLQNDPIVLSKCMMECMTFRLEQQGFGTTNIKACQLYMRETITDCDNLVRLAIAQKTPITRTDVRQAGKGHEPAYPRDRREKMKIEDVENRILDGAAHSLTFRFDKKGLPHSMIHCIYARAEGLAFIEKLQRAGLSANALARCRFIIATVKNQKTAYRRIAEDITRMYPEDAKIICLIYLSLPHIQRAELHPLNKETYEKQLAVCAAKPAHRRHFHLCLICLSSDLPCTPGWRREKCFLTDLSNIDRIYCPNCIGEPSVIKFSLLGVRLQLMDNSYILCTECLEPEIFSTHKISDKNFVVCNRCINHNKVRAIWHKPDKRQFRSLAE